MSRKRNVKPRFYLLLMIVLVAVFFGVYLSQSGLLNQRARQIEQLEAQRKLAEEQNAELERKIAFSKTPEYVIRVGHDELGLLKPGEIRYVAGADTSASQLPQETPEPGENVIANGQ